MDDAISGTCGGGGVGSMDGEACDTWRGEGGGGRSMDGATCDTSGLGGGIRLRGGGSVNGVVGDTCGGD